MISFESQQRRRQRRQQHPQPSSSSLSSSISFPQRKWNINVTDDDRERRPSRSKHGNVSITHSVTILVSIVLVLLFYVVPSSNKYDKYDIVDHHNIDFNRTLYIDHKFYRYSNVRWHTDIISSHQFLVQELQRILSLASSQSLSRYDTTHLPSFKLSHPYIPTVKRPQLIIGRFGTSESEVMEYAIRRWNHTSSNTTVTESIPSNFYTPGYYFTNNETTLQERSKTVQQWGWQRIRSYADMNVFAILDWGNTHHSNSGSSSSSSRIGNNNPSHTLQMRGIEMYAPKSGYIHANVVMYPPCLTIPKLYNNDPRNNSAKVIVPWTLQLENKIILIVHPFIDTIRQNIPKLHSSIWSNVQNDHVYGAPYSCFPNVTEFKLVRTPLPTKTKQISWLDSLQGIQKEIDQVGYFDIAILGCGGYGLPLISYISKLSFAPSAIYVGGALQLFFGIHGTRWSVPQLPNHQRHPITNDQQPVSSSSSSSSYYEMWSHIYNDAWIWPLSSDIINSTIGMIENGAYVQPEQAINQAIVQRHKWFDQ